MRRIAIPLLALMLAGCAATTKPTAPQVSVEGPKFAATQFRCGAKPVPPDPQKGPAGKAAARYENALGTWGQNCANRLESIGTALGGAGQLERAK